MSASEYKVEVHARSEAEGGGFIAVVAELPACSSTGATREEAAQKAVSAIAKFLAGKSVPA